jgi:hypothetical protein
LEGDAVPGNGDVSRTATTFTVQELVQRAWDGKVRVPHFQRPFRWKWDDAQKLFDSIISNYPIGSLLLWARPAPAGHVQLGALSLDAPETKEALWVVDGQQRITSLANVLHRDAQSNPQFAMSYDLKTRRFVKPRAKDDALTIPLPVLFDGQLVLRWFFEHPEVSESFNEASALTDKLRNYAIPAYQVEHSDESVLQDIFDRMNNYGKRLTKAEVFTALNAGSEAGAANQLTFPRIAEHLDNERGFGLLDEGVILQAVLIRRHPDIQREIRNEFGADDREGRDAAFQAAEDALKRAVAFLQDDVGIPHVAMLPYSYLLVVLVRFFAFFPEPERRNRDLLRRWYWRAAVRGPGIFPGGTTGASRIIGQRIEGDESGSVQGMLDALGERPAKLPVPEVRRRFRANEAVSKLLLSSWWAHRPRDPEKGAPYDRIDLALSLEQRATASPVVYPLVSSTALTGDGRFSAANRVLLPVLDHDPAEVRSLLTDNLGRLPDDVWTKVLESHLMTPAMAELLRQDKTDEFLAQRQELMHKAVAQFLTQNCEWGFEDTPPLADLVIEDEDEDADG